jgi:hypothetical protein
MKDNNITGTKKNKIIPTIAIIIVIIIILLSIYIWNNFQSESKEKDVEEQDSRNMDQLEFTIDIIGSIDDLENMSFYFQLKNISNKTLNYTYPELVKTINFFAVAPNGTKYQCTGPFNGGPFFWKSFSSGEITDGYIGCGFKIGKAHNSGISYTSWKNFTKDEYWFFQPGTYEIYSEYESIPNDSIDDVIVGIWISNVTILTIE